MKLVFMTPVQMVFPLQLQEESVGANHRLNLATVSWPSTEPQGTMNIANNRSLWIC